MLSFDLKNAAAKLEREQRERGERERQKREKERMLAERQRQRQQQREEEAARRRQELLAAEQRVRLARVGGGDGCCLCAVVMLNTSTGQGPTQLAPSACAAAEHLTHHSLGASPCRCELLATACAAAHPPCRCTPFPYRQELEERQAALEANRGVYLKLHLQAAPADSSAALQRGIRRWRDKLTLPPSMGAALMAQVGAAACAEGRAVASATDAACICSL